MISDAEIRELDAEVTRATSAGELTASLRAISNYCGVALSELYSDEVRRRARVYLAAVLASRHSVEGSVVVDEDLIARGTPH
jgi:isoleucyl-tRNA synthetase